MLPDVTLIIPTYQGYHWLTRLLPAIQQQTYPGCVEILAIDSSSSDGTVDLLTQYGVTVISIRQADFSHGYARNLAVQHAQTPLVIFLSQDVLPVGTDWLVRLVHLLDDSTIGAAHVRQLPRPGATPLEAFFHQEMYPPRSRRFEWKTNERMTLNRLFFSNVCSVTRRELCLRFPFPENLIMSEDQAFARALLQAGYATLYSADVAVIHSHSYSLTTLFRRNFDSAYSLRGITEDTLWTTILEGLRYTLHEAHYLIRQKRWRWLPYMLLYEIIRAAGRLCGGHADHLPYWLRVRLSLHRSFWSIPKIRSPQPTSHNAL